MESNLNLSQENKVSELTKQHISSSITWMKSSAVIGIIITFIISIFFGLFVYNLYNAYEQLTAFANANQNNPIQKNLFQESMVQQILITLIVYLLFGIYCIITLTRLSILMLKKANAFSLFITSGDSIRLENAFLLTKKYWRSNSIYIIVLTVFIVVTYLTNFLTIR